MATDTMDTAIGSVFRGEVMYKVLDSNVAKQTIAHKEWLAFAKTVLPNFEEQCGYVARGQHECEARLAQQWYNHGQMVVQGVAQKLFLSLGYPQIDLMATSRSNQVPLYFSALTDNGAGVIDALTKDWDRFSLS